MAKITIITFLAILLQVNCVFSQFPGGCRAGETSTGNRCLGFEFQQCPLGQICRSIPGSSPGVCCRSFSTWDVCPSGSIPTGQTCGVFVRACPTGSFCHFIPNTDYGYCCVYGN